MPLDERPIILSPELSDLATKVNNTPSSYNEKYPFTNAFTDHPSVVWRPGLTPIEVDFDFGSNQVIDSLFLGYYYGSVTGSSGYRLWAYSDAFSTITYDSGLVNFSTLNDPALTEQTRRNFFAFTFNGFGGVARRYWRLQVASTGANPGTLNWYIGRIILAKAFIPTRNFDFGWQLKWMQDVERDRSYSGGLYSTHKSRYRHLDIEFSYNSETECFNDFYLLDLKRRLDKPVVVCLNPENPTYLSRRLIYGPMAELTPIENQYLGYYRKRFVLHEMEGL